MCIWKILLQKQKDDVFGNFNFNQMITWSVLLQTGVDTVFKAVVCLEDCIKRKKKKSKKSRVVHFGIFYLIKKLCFGVLCFQQE